jgi:hypothetical protein
MVHPHDYVREVDGPAEGTEPKAPLSPRHVLQALAASFRYRVVQDAEGWPVIPGRYGRLEWHDGETLAVYSDRPRVFARLWAVPGIRRWQVGDREARALVPVDALPHVAALIGARRRRQLSPEAARNLGARTAYRGTSVP